MMNKCLRCIRKHHSHYHWLTEIPISTCSKCFGWGSINRPFKDRFMIDEIEFRLCKNCLGIGFSPIPLTEFYDE